MCSPHGNPTQINTAGGHPAQHGGAETGASDEGGRITVDSGQWRTLLQVMRGNKRASFYASKTKTC